ncbi:hypothetical protein [Salipiger bermudensis]|uniref:hypothetical protein n=1 Tax=Salipiger bermudensis TaxID=344736 RepID=UPI001CD1E201|nr:hypothetical protein [Salipiger bermudensis]MCA0961966.1 hypothetical protein [Salipiger bermudensis]
MSKTITLTDTSLKEIIRMAVKMGSMNLGAKQDRLVKAVFEEAEEKAEDVIIRKPIKFDISTEGLELIEPKAGCVVPESEINIIGGNDPHRMVNVEITAEVCESKIDMMKSRTSRFDEHDLKRGEAEYLLRRRTASCVTPDLPKTARESLIRPGSDREQRHHTTAGKLPCACQRRFCSRG